MQVRRVCVSEVSYERELKLEMSSEVFDCIVIGAGIQGSCTAYQLAKNKQKTLLLEQFVLPHSRGSSHGQTRVIRKTYEEDFYIQMMHESYELWAQLEREAGVELHRRTGLLVMGPENGEGFSRLKATMQKHKIPTVFLEKQEFSQHIPNVNLADGNGALIDTFAGVLYADRALRAVQRLFQSCGGVIKDGEKVIDIRPGVEVTVTTGSGVYRGRSLVISAGPWVNTLLTHTGLQLPLKVQLTSSHPPFIYSSVHSFIQLTTCLLSFIHLPNFFFYFTHSPFLFICLSIHQSIHLF